MSAFDQFAREMRLLGRQRVRIYRRDEVRPFFARLYVPGDQLLELPAPAPGGGIRKHLGKPSPFELKMARLAEERGATLAAIGGPSAWSPDPGSVPVVTEDDRLDVVNGTLRPCFVLTVYSAERAGWWYAEYRPNGTLGGWMGSGAGTAVELASHNRKEALRAALVPEAAA